MSTIDNKFKESLSKEVYLTTDDFALWISEVIRCVKNYTFDVLYDVAKIINLYSKYRNVNDKPVNYEFYILLRDTGSDLVQVNNHLFGDYLKRNRTGFQLTFCFNWINFNEPFCIVRKININSFKEIVGIIRNPITFTISKLKRELKLYYNYDKWGYTMDALFEILGHLHAKGEFIDDKYKYKPGLEPVRISSAFHEFVSEHSTEELKIMAEFLFRYSRYLRFKGLSY